jgi:hypothetical protein
MKPLSERDSAIMARHAAGSSIREIADAMNVSKATVRRIVEHVGPVHALGRELLAADPESLSGLGLTGASSQRACGAIANAPYKVDVPDTERLSDVAAQGRKFVARFPGIGGAASKSMAELDTMLASFGIAWNPRPRPFAWRDDKNRHPSVEANECDRAQIEQDAKRSEYWAAIVRRVAEMERALGTGFMQDTQGRDGMQGISYRLAYLSDCVQARAERDITPEPDDQDDGDYETAGNLICLPGVKLADVQPNDGDRP